MRYAPYDAEYALVGQMNDSQVMEYFLTRVFESEEVWSLDNKTEWITRELGEDTLLPVWPYEKYAQENSVGKWRDFEPSATSLEDFVYNLLPALIGDDILLEIMPRDDKVGCIVSPQRLMSILEGMLDAGEYTLDG